MATGDLARLAAAVKTQRLNLGLAKEAIARSVDMSSITWKRIEDGLAVRGDSYARAERALGWSTGSIEAILAGGAPTDLRSEPATPVGSGVDPGLLDDLAHLDPAAVEKVRAYVRGLKDGSK